MMINVDRNGLMWEFIKPAAYIPKDTMAYVYTCICNVYVYVYGMHTKHDKIQ